MSDLNVHYGVYFGILVTFAVVAGFIVFQALTLFSRPAKAQKFLDSSFNVQAISVTFFCALYLITEFAKQANSPNPTMPVVDEWVLVMLGMSNALVLGRKVLGS